MQRSAEGLLVRGDRGVGVDIEPVSTFADLPAKQEFITRNFTANEIQCDCNPLTQHLPIASLCRSTQVWWCAQVCQHGGGPVVLLRRPLGREGGCRQGHLLDSAQHPRYADPPPTKLCCCGSSGVGG